MNIVGSGKKVLDKELLAKLAVSKKSGNQISTVEAQKAVKAAARALKDEFDGSSSSSGLARAETAVANTLKLALDSGWVKGGQAREVIEEFLSSADKGSLKATISAIKSDIKANGGGSVGYGGGRPSGGGGRPSGGGGSVSYGSRPRPRPVSPS